MIYLKNQKKLEKFSITSQQQAQEISDLLNQKKYNFQMLR